MTATPLEKLLKNYRLRQLNDAEGVKPLDFGGRGINGSLNRDGRIIAINTYHPEYGYVTLTSAPPFDEDLRYDPQAVRDYRKSLTRLEGFGLMFRLPIVRRQAWLVQDAIPYIRLTLGNGVVADCVTFVPEYEYLTAAQIWAFSESGSFAHMSGKVWLQRCAYTQLTEGGPLWMPSVKSSVFYDRPIGAVGFHNEALGLAAFITGTYGLQENPDGSLSFKEPGFTYPAFSEDAEPTTTPDQIDFKFGLGGNLHEAMSRSGGLGDPTIHLQNSLNTWKARWEVSPPHEAPPFALPPLDIDDLNLDLGAALAPLRQRALVYGLNCCVPIDSEAVCILTDHMLLPLSWNRDAYYVAMALLGWLPEMAAQVKGHLIWMFERAQRDDGLWGRAYLANGRIKDRGFQLDQQLYPLLELVEYTQHTGDKATFERLHGQIRPVLDQLMTRCTTHHWLFPTDETPADDPIAYPYHLSSHILLWRVLTKLAEVDGLYDYANMAAQVHYSIHQHFITDWGGRQVYAYATDGGYKRHLYHDANDIPLAYAPLWGFVGADDPIWGATMDFAFSAQNKGGYYEGQLGSVHTPAPWPLGDLQGVLWGRIKNDSPTQARFLNNLRLAAQWDGALPEAYSSANYSVSSRHWFAWPNALFALLLASPAPDMNKF